MMRLALAGLLAIPFAAGAFEWTGAAGLGYSRADSWNDAGLHNARPRLDLNLKLDARGFISDPGILKWSGSVGYGRVNDRPEGAPALLSDALNYKLDLALFRYRGAPLTAALYAQRYDSRFGPTLSSSTVGERRFDLIGGSVAVAVRSLPFFTFGFDRQNSTDSIPGLAPHESEKDVLSAGFTHSNEAFGLTAQYRGQWSDGNWVTDQQSNYSLTASGQSATGANGRVYFSEAYYDQTPNAGAAGAVGSLKTSVNAFQAGYITGVERGDQSQLSYSYGHGVTTTPTADQESARQSIRGEHDLPLSRGGSRSWINLLADASLTEQRSSTLSLESEGVTVGGRFLHLRTSGDSHWEAGGGPVVSYLHTPTDSSVGYGASAAGRLNRGWGANRVGLSYGVDYGNDVYGLAGWSFNQNLGASLSGPALERAQFNANVVASARRGWSPVLGDGSSRSLYLNGRLTMARYTFDATASVASGIAGSAPKEFMGDGLFLPAGYDTHTIFGSVGATARIFEGFNAHAELRLSDSKIPGQPDYSVVEGRAGFTYRYAAFDLSIEEQLSRSNSAAGTVTGNLVMFSVARSIGSRF